MTTPVVYKLFTTRDEDTPFVVQKTDVDNSILRVYFAHLADAYDWINIDSRRVYVNFDALGNPLLG